MEQLASRQFGFRSAYAALVVLFAIDLVVFMDRAVLAAVLLPIEERFTLTNAAAGLLATVFSISYCTSLPIVGWLSDRIPRKFVLAGGIAIWGVTSLATGLAQTWEQLLLVRCLTGIGEATCAPLGPALIADCFPRWQRSRALAVLFAAIPIGSALGLALGGQAAPFDWRWAFFLTGALGMLAACSALTIDEPRRQAQAPRAASQAGWMALLRERTFVFTTLGMALMVFALIGWNVRAPTFLAKQRGMSLEDTGTCLGILVGVTGVGGAALGGWLGDRLSGRGPAALLALTGVTTLTAVPCFAVALWAANSALLFTSLALGLTLVFLNVGPLDTVLINVTSAKTRGTAFALNVLLIHLVGEMPAPFLVGAVSDWAGNLVVGLTTALVSLGIGGLVFCWTIRVLRR